jgi:hypothetical protein
MIGATEKVPVHSERRWARNGRSLSQQTCHVTTV